MITYKSTFDVQLVDSMGTDQLICMAARVSTLGDDSINTEESAGLINFLMKNRHGTPFEHGAMMFRISCPIFVWREYMRHRIGFSYNEQSGRYMELSPVFYVPDRNRPLTQIGKPGHYEFVEGTLQQYETAQLYLRSAYEASWVGYKAMLDAGIAKEVARMCLPVALYSTAYVTLNPRSMMNFLSLRTKDENSLFPSFPMHEINCVANYMEEMFEHIFPITHAAFENARRVAP